MEVEVPVIEYRQLSDIKSNDVNISLLDSMSQEVQLADYQYQSYANEVHNEGLVILDSNMDAFTREPNEENVQTSTRE